MNSKECKVDHSVLVEKIGSKCVYCEFAEVVNESMQAQATIRDSIEVISELMRAVVDNVPHDKWPFFVHKMRAAAIADAMKGKER